MARSARLQPQMRDANLGNCPTDAGDGRLRAHCTRNTSTPGPLEPFGVDQLLRIFGSDLFAAAYPGDGRSLAARSARPFRGTLLRTRVLPRHESLAVGRSGVL